MLPFHPLLQTVLIQNTNLSCLQVVLQLLHYIKMLMIPRWVLIESPKVADFFLAPFEQKMQRSLTRRAPAKETSDIRAVRKMITKFNGNPCTCSFSDWINWSSQKRYGYLKYSSSLWNFPALYGVLWGFPTWSAFLVKQQTGERFTPFLSFKSGTDQPTSWQPSPWRPVNVATLSYSPSFSSTSFI